MLYSGSDTGSGFKDMGWNLGFSICEWYVDKQEKSALYLSLLILQISGKINTYLVLKMKYEIVLVNNKFGTVPAAW